MRNEERYKILGKEGDYYTIVCKFCHEDKELWYKPLKIRKSHYENNVCCCGCDGRPRFNLKQKEIRCRRILEKLGYEFKSLIENGAGWIVNCYNESTGNYWKVGYMSLISKGCTDPKEPHKNKLKDDEYIERFSHNYESGTEFVRLSEDKWEITCPTCKSDEYTLAGVCSGTFEVRISSLLRGNKPCRCSKRPSWTESQIEYKIHKLLREEGIPQTIEWIDDYSDKKRKSKFKWLCKQGHSCNTAVGNFIGKSDRCKICNSSCNGYYPERCSEQDNLYIVKLPDGSFKIGRSFSLQERFKRITRAFNKVEGKGEIEVIRIIEGIHSEMYNLEQQLLDLLDSLGLRLYRSWTAESFKKEGIVEVENKIEDYLQTSSL